MLTSIEKEPGVRGCGVGQNDGRARAINGFAPNGFAPNGLVPSPALVGVAALDGVVLAQAWAAVVPKGQHIVVVARDVT